MSAHRILGLKAVPREVPASGVPVVVLTAAQGSYAGKG